jgi:uncharacterized repeat protein (TIGR02543 family)
VTPTATPTATPSVTPTETPSVTPTETPSVTPTATPTATPSVTPTETPSVTPTATPSVTPTATPSVTPSATPSVTPTETPSVTPSATPSVTPTETPSVTPTETPSIIPTETPTATPTATPIPPTDTTTYSIMYDANGGRGSVIDSNKYKWSQKVEVLSGQGLRRAGYIFQGWNTKEDGTGSDIKVGSTLMIKNDVTLFAQWSKSNTIKKDVTKATIRSASSVKTGDDHTILSYIIIMLTTASCGCIALRKRKVF